MLSGVRAFAGSERGESGSVMRVRDWVSVSLAQGTGMTVASRASRSADAEGWCVLLDGGWAW